jgi:hypothetical protein
MDPLQMSPLSDQALGLLHQQREHWPLLAENHRILEQAKIHTMEFDGFSVKVQFNPGRYTSSAAKTDPEAIRGRTCFLCRNHLPAGQKSLDYGDYYLLCNPYPIFRDHLTIPHSRHIPQNIEGHIGAMLDLAHALGSRFTVLYNGPRCGASAPDHMHFQAGEAGFMPIDTEWRRIVERYGVHVIDDSRLRVARVDDGLRRFVVMESANRTKLVEQFGHLYRRFKAAAGGRGWSEEPMLNILAGVENGRLHVIIFLRRKHRPDRYYAEGDDQMLVSPGVVDFGGVCILPVEQDFERITDEDLRSIFREVSAETQMLGEVVPNPGR